MAAKQVGRLARFLAPLGEGQVGAANLAWLRTYAGASRRPGAFFDKTWKLPDASFGKAAIETMVCQAGVLRFCDHDRCGRCRTAQSPAGDSLPVTLRITTPRGQSVPVDVFSKTAS